MKTPAPNCDLTIGLKHKAKALDAFLKQKAWIEWCESNGESYTGENGDDIRRADESELRARRAELEMWESKR